MLDKNRLRQFLNLIQGGAPVRQPVLQEKLECTAGEISQLIANARDAGLSVTRPGSEVVWQDSRPLINEDSVSQNLDSSAAELLDVIRTPLYCNSSNDEARELLAQGHKNVLIATDFQHLGRGRRGRTWNSSLASGLCFSLGLSFEAGTVPDSSLAIVCGIETAHSLKNSTGCDVLLKWPNDLIIGDSKLGGVLVESQLGPNQQWQVIIGIGLNVFGAPDMIQRFGSHALPSTALQNHASSDLDRIALLGRVVSDLLSAMHTFSATGHVALSKRFLQLDYLLHRPVHIIFDDHVEKGVAKGITNSGELLVEINGETRELTSGDISVRPV